MAENEAGEPAVEPPAGHDLGDPVIGPNKVGHDVLAGRWSGPDHRLDEPDRDRHSEERTGPDDAAWASQSVQLTVKGVCIPSFR